MTNTRRNFLKTATVAGMARFGAMNALAQAPDYKALVCIFMVGGNDGNSMVVPQTQTEFNAYKAIRGSLALPDTNVKLLPVSMANGTPYALTDGLAKIHPFWAQKKLAVVANVGMLVQPTTRAQFVSSAVPLPTNLFSHSDQTVQMQAGTAGSASTGLGRQSGRRIGRNERRQELSTLGFHVWPGTIFEGKYRAGSQPHSRV